METLAVELTRLFLMLDIPLLLMNDIDNFVFTLTALMLLSLPMKEMSFINSHSYISISHKWPRYSGAAF